MKRSTWGAVGRAVMVGCGVVAFSGVLALLALNVVLNCRTWDRAQWTEASSCIGPADFVRTLAGGAGPSTRGSQP